MNGLHEWAGDEEVGFVFLGLKMEAELAERCRSLLTEAVVQVPSSGNSACCLLKVH